MNINNNQPGNIVGSQSLPQGGVQMQKDQNTNVQNHVGGVNLSSQQETQKPRTVWQAISSFFKGIGNFFKNIFSPKTQVHSVPSQTLNESPATNPDVNISDETKQDLSLKTLEQPKSEIHVVSDTKPEAQQGDSKITSSTDNSENIGENISFPSSSSNPTPDAQAPTLVKPTDDALQAEIAKRRAKANPISQPASQGMPQVEPKAPEAKQNDTSAPLNIGDVPPPPPPPPPPAPAPKASQSKGAQNINDVKLKEVEPKKKELNHLDLIKARNFKLRPIKSEADQLKTKLGWPEERWEEIKSKHDRKRKLSEEEINQLISAARIQDTSPVSLAQQYALRYANAPKDALKILEGKIPGLAEILGHKKMEHSESAPNLLASNKPLESQQSLKKSASESEIMNMGTPPPPPPPPAQSPNSVASSPKGGNLDFRKLIEQGVKLRKEDPNQKNEKPAPKKAPEEMNEAELLFAAAQNPNTAGSEKWDDIPEEFLEGYKKVDNDWNNSDENDDDIREKAQTLLDNILKAVGGEDNVKEDSDLSDKIERLEKIIDGTAEKDEDW